MLSGNLTLGTVIVASLLGATTVSAGKDDEVQSGPERAMIDGSIEPEKIPDYLKYGSLIRWYEQRGHAALRNELSLEDQEILRKMAVEEPVEQAAVTESYRQARIHLCANRGNTTPVEIAMQWEQMVLDWRLKNEARYRKGLESLSTEGRQVVEEYVATEVVPGIKVGAPEDSVEVARKDPELYMEAVESECYVALNGRFHPDEERLHEEFGKALMEDRRNQE